MKVADCCIKMVFFENSINEIDTNKRKVGSGLGFPQGKLDPAAKRTGD